MKSPIRLIKNMNDRRLTPRQRRHSDTFIVEFPKSGVTWLSTILANVALIESKKKEVATFASAHMYIPDIHISRDIEDLPYNRPPVRLIKSHSEGNIHYKNIIYLSRRPECVMKSYFEFSNNIAFNRFSDFRKFCLSPVFGLPAWRRHVNSWLRESDISTRIFCLRYEDLLKSPDREIQDISDFFGWEFSCDAVRRAVSISTREAMIADEARYSSRNPRHDFKFVGSKPRERGDEWLEEEVRRTCRKELSLLGYSE